MKKYDAIAQDLSNLVATMKPGEQIPSEQALVERYQVSGMTVRRALQVLSRAGRIQGIPGRGTFVVEPRLQRPLASASFSETMRSAGRVPTSRLISAAIKPPTDDEAQALALESSGRVFHVNRLRLGDGVPLAVEYATLSADPFPGLLGLDFETTSLYSLLRSRYGVVVSRTQFDVVACNADSETSELLEISTTLPCLETRTISSDQHGTPVELTRSVYRGDLYSLRFAPDAPATDLGVSSSN